jgi:RNA polymerase sigma-70 factor (ECF subfamily)
MPIAQPSMREQAGLHLLVQRARGGDANAFAEIYGLYYPRVLGLCRRRLGQDEAEDAASIAFLKTHRALATYDPSQPFLPWLFSVARNQCLDRLRQRKLERERFLAEDVSPRLPARNGVSPLTQVLKAEQRRQLRKKIDRLPARYRVPLVLRYQAEMSYAEIARRLGLRRNTVATAILRAKRELRRSLRHSVPRPC